MSVCLAKHAMLRWQQATGSSFLVHVIQGLIIVLEPCAMWICRLSCTVIVVRV